MSVLCSGIHSSLREGPAFPLCLLVWLLIIGPEFGSILSQTRGGSAMFLPAENPFASVPVLAPKGRARAPFEWLGRLEKERKSAAVPRASRCMIGLCWIGKDTLGGWKYFHLACIVSALAVRIPSSGLCSSGGETLFGRQHATQTVTGRATVYSLQYAIYSLQSSVCRFFHWEPVFPLTFSTNKPTALVSGSLPRLASPKEPKGSKEPKCRRLIGSESITCVQRQHLRLPASLPVHLRPNA